MAELREAGMGLGRLGGTEAWRGSMRNGRRKGQENDGRERRGLKSNVEIQLSW